MANINIYAYHNQFQKAVALLKINFVAIRTTPQSEQIAMRIKKYKNSKIYLKRQKEDNLYANKNRC